MEFLIQVPIKDDAARSYFLARYCVDGVYKLSTRNVIGLTLVHLLKERPRKITGILKYNPETSVNINLGMKTERASRFWLGPTETKHFNKVLNHLLEDEFIKWMTIWCNQGLKIQRGIYSFMEAYKLSDTEKEFEKWKKIFYRHRKASESLSPAA